MAAVTFLSHAVGVLAPWLRVELGLSRAALGTVVLALFAVAGLGSPAAGVLTDRFDNAHVLRGMLVLAAAGLLLAGVARSHAELLAAGAVAGLGLAFAPGVTNSLIGRHIQAGRRGYVVGWNQAGVQIGAFAAGTGLPVIAGTLGWRSALLLSGVAALVLAALGPRTISSRHAAPPATHVGHRVPMPLADVVVWVALYAFSTSLAVSVVATYLPLYAYERLGFSPIKAGVLGGVVGLAGVAGRIGWGAQAERSQVSTRSLLHIALAGVVAVLAIWLAEPISPNLVWIGAVLFGGGALSWSSVGMFVIMRDVAGGAAGRAAGVMQLGFSLGYVVGPISFGRWVDSASTYGPAWTAAALTLGGAALVTTLWARRRRKRPALLP